MQAIIGHNILNVNKSQRSNYPLKHNILCSERGDVHKKHLIIKDAVKSLSIKRSLRTLLEELVNNSNFEGVTRISYKKLSELLTCSISTIKNYLAKLSALGIIAWSKNGWQQTNTTTLLPIKNKLCNKEPNSDCYLNTHNSYQRSNNINHYNEYESVFDNSQKKEEIRPTKTNHPPPDSPKNEQKTILMSESRAENETLCESVQNFVNESINDEHKPIVELTLKRLRASADEKLRLAKEFVGCANQFVIQNVGGLLVSRFKKMKEKTVSAKIRNTRNENNMRSQALMRAEEELQRLGITDPRLGISPTYDEIREYEAKAGAMFVKMLREIKSKAESKITKARKIEIEAPPKIWSEKFYS